MAAPTAFQMATYALDGASYAATGKSASDHMISAVADKDCAMIRALKGEDICVENPDTVVLMPDGSRPANAQDVAQDVKPANEDQAFLAFSAANDQSGDVDNDEVLNANQPVQVARVAHVQVAYMPAISAVPVIPVEDAPLAAVGARIERVTPPVPKAPIQSYETGLYDDDEVLSEEDIERLDRELRTTATLSPPKI